MWIHSRIHNRNWSREIFFRRLLESAGWLRDPELPLILSAQFILSTNHTCTSVLSPPELSKSPNPFDPPTDIGIAFHTVLVQGFSLPGMDGKVSDCYGAGRLEINRKTNPRITLEKFQQPPPPPPHPREDVPSYKCSKNTPLYFYIFQFSIRAILVEIDSKIPN